LFCGGIVAGRKWAHLGSNQGPTGYEPVALPAELWALSTKFFLSSQNHFVKLDGELSVNKVF
jgi:hypothetical protein